MLNNLANIFTLNIYKYYLTLKAKIVNFSVATLFIPYLNINKIKKF